MFGLTRSILSTRALMSRSMVSNRNLASRPEDRVTATLIPGDGVGPELVASVEEVFKAAAVPMDFEVYFMSEVHSALSSPVRSVVDSISRNGICLKGILTTPSFSASGEADTLNIRMRIALDLYANVVKVASIPGVKSRHTDVDLVVIREQTEGEYSCLEHESVPGIVESLKVVTGRKSLRIAKFAFDYATKHGRKKVTAVHKANIMKLGDGLFLRSCIEISKLYPHIKFEEMIVDNCCMQMVAKPQQFDVMVITPCSLHLAPCLHIAPRMFSCPGDAEPIREYPGEPGGGVGRWRGAGGGGGVQQGLCHLRARGEVRTDRGHLLG